MDLVDIDEVLDNLELNEEGQKADSSFRKIETIASNNLNSAEVLSTIPKPQLNETSQPRANAVTPLSQERSSSSTNDRTNKFIGVSQVFSSLNDYRKNVESLEATMQIHNNDQHFVRQSNDDLRIVSPLTDMNESIEGKDDDISKFVSTDEEQELSSNSLTTSSSSTFSSGLSPALHSTDSDQSFEGRFLKDDPKMFEQNLQLKDASSARVNNCESNEPIRSDYEDLAVGLSSISLTNYGITLSSELTSNKCSLDREGDISSTISTSQITNRMLELKKSLDQHQADFTDNGMQEPAKTQFNLDCPDRIKTQPPLINPNPMVTFGSTVDEISDTELDSLLQEIDEEMPLQNSIDITDQRTVLGSEELQKNDQLPTTDPTGETSLSRAVINNVLKVDGNMQQRKPSEDDNIAKETCATNDNNCDGLNDNDKDKDKQSITQKKPRPTTLDLSARKINLYATAGQTPPGSRVYEPTTSSSEENSPENKLDLPQNDEMTTNADGNLPPHNSANNEDALANDLENVPIPEFNETMSSSVVGGNQNITSMSSNQHQQLDSLQQYQLQQQPYQATEQHQSLTEFDTNTNIGKVPPIWVPDHETNVCMQCQHKFTIIRRRHHCRACGKVLCSVCCSEKYKLEFLSNVEARVCVQCFIILSKIQRQIQQQTNNATTASSLSSSSSSMSPHSRSPNPNNPMEYCSTIPPHRQVNSQGASCPSVIVPVGVLKKDSDAKKSRKRKSVMFSDGIRPGSDLESLEGKWSDAKHARKSSNYAASDEGATGLAKPGATKHTQKDPSKTIFLTDGKDSFLHKGEKALPPVCSSNKTETSVREVPNNVDLMKRLQTECLKFVVQTNFYVYVKIAHLKCCINKTVINFTTHGLHHVGNDEIIILLEVDNTNEIPKDIFVHLNEIYIEASKGHQIKELGFSMPKDLPFLGSRDHSGFLYIRSTFQCLQNVYVPDAPFLIGILIHRWEMPWAKLFPLRLMLRLGAQYRYYPSPHISVRQREPVYGEIAQTIINLLADFRNYTYTLLTVRGMFIHMEDRKTSILIPRNSYDEVIKAINNSSDHILAMGANFSKKADGHLVCIQNTNPESSDSHSYSTQAINIQGQPRKVTGASFFVLNEALKTTSGLAGKCSMVEDGLMVQILPTKMAEIKNALINMKDIDIVCGPIEAGEQQTEMVLIKWVPEDPDINLGVKSPIDGKLMDGVPSIRVHLGVALSNNHYILKWTEVFTLQINGDSKSCCAKPQFDVTLLSEGIAKNTCVALLPFLDLLAASRNLKIGLRVTLSEDKVCYEAGSQYEKLPPLYMRALDNELIPILHRQANEIGKLVVLELIFYILKK